MCELIDKYFIAIAGTVLTLSFGGYITWRIYTKKRYIEAADKFRNTVFTELEGLYPTPAKWPSRDIDIIKILKDKFPKLEIAVTEFGRHLGWFKRKRFNHAWQEYNKDYFQYVPMQGQSYSYGKLIETHDTTKTYHDNFRKNVDALLKFAKQP